jgi:hypothetical protein
MNNHLQYVVQAEAAINRVFSDQTVDKNQTLASLQELQELIEDLCVALKADGATE